MPIWPNPQEADRDVELVLVALALDELGADDEALKAPVEAEAVLDRLAGNDVVVDAQVGIEGSARMRAATRVSTKLDPEIALNR